MVLEGGAPLGISFGGGWAPDDLIRIAKVRITCTYFIISLVN